MKKRDSPLLTPEQWNAAAERGVTRWMEQLKEPTAFESSAPFVYEEVCCAQLREVVKWAKPVLATGCPEPRDIAQCVKEYRDCARCRSTYVIDALEAAGGPR